MDKKILTVIVPSYNMEAYLAKGLQSLIVDDKDLFRKFEVIVVNDGSKDHTSEIAHGFAREFPGIFHVIDKSNGHYGSCINAALPEAQGEYVKVLDADDSVDTKSFCNFCRAVLEEVEKGDDGADLLVSPYQTIMTNGELKATVDYGLLERKTYYTLDEYPVSSPRFTIHSITYRTDFIRKMGYRQTEGMCYTDTEWIIEPMTKVRRFRYFKEVVTYYRLGRDGQSMDPVIFGRDFQCVADITVGLVMRYGRLVGQCEATAKRYYRRRVEDMVRKIYRGWAVGFCGCTCKVNIEEFDRRIKGIADFYEKATDLYIGLNRYHYYFVRDFRKWHFRYTPKWLMYKLAMLMAKPYSIILAAMRKVAGRG